MVRMSIQHTGDFDNPPAQVAKVVAESMEETENGCFGVLPRSRECGSLRRACPKLTKTVRS